jgi:glucan endo-1,3-alpha-glucosidase
MLGSGGGIQSEGTCGSACGGDASTHCGGSWVLSLYQYQAPANSTPSCGVVPTSIVTPAPTSVKSSTTASPTATPAPNDSSEWFALGCAVDADGSGRVLNGFSNTALTDLTVDDCLTMCEDKGFAYAGVEYGQQCYCGATIPSSVSYNEAGCNMPCAGNASETCGGGWALDLYHLIPSDEVCTTGSVTATLTVGNVVAVSGTASVTLATTTAAPVATNVPSSSSDHVVWAHHMVGNTYPYSQSSWLSDVNTASSAGIDGFALNMGSDYWQPDRIADAYSAAQSSGTNFKLFLSLDMTSLGCSSSNDANTLVSLVQRFANHPNQAKHNGKTLVSTFAGSDCTFGTGSVHGWQSSFVDALTNSGYPIFFVPSIFSDVSTFASNSWMDGELNWNSGWPMDGSDLTTSSDSTYMAALGSKEYMPAISPFFFTHFSPQTWNKNWLYRGDDWLYCTRWEQVIAMRNSVKMTEILTWNDYGESSYIGPITGALPAGSEVWTNGYDHTGLSVLTKYYATAFKTGQYPAITQDSITMWSRPHPHDATAQNDGTGKPTGWDWTDDNLYAVVLTKGAAIVTMTSGSNTQSWSVSAGLTKLKMPSSVGGISGRIFRDGAIMAAYTSGSTFQYTNSPSTYNYNYIVGSSS